MRRAWGQGRPWWVAGPGSHAERLCPRGCTGLPSPETSIEEPDVGLRVGGRPRPSPGAGAVSFLQRCDGHRDVTGVGAGKALGRSSGLRSRGEVQGAPLKRKTEGRGGSKPGTHGDVGEDRSHKCPCLRGAARGEESIRPDVRQQRVVGTVAKWRPGLMGKAEL